MNKKRMRKPKVIRRKETINIRVKIVYKKIQKTSETKSWFLERINKIHKLLTRLVKKKRPQINKIRNEKRELSTNTTEIQRIRRKHYNHLYSTNLDNLEEMDKSLKTYIIPRLNQDETKNLNGLIPANKIKLVIKKLPTSKIPQPYGFRGKFYQTFKEELAPIFSNYPPKNLKRRECSLYSHFAKCFYHEWVLYFIKFFFCIYC